LTTVKSDKHGSHEHHVASVVAMAEPTDVQATQ
jgi:hypothetical protein